MNLFLNTARQVEIANKIWESENFEDALSTAEEYGLEGETILNLIVLEATDRVHSTDEAMDILQKYMK